MTRRSLPEKSQNLFGSLRCRRQEWRVRKKSWSELGSTEAGSGPRQVLVKMVLNKGDEFHEHSSLLGYTSSILKDRSVSLFRVRWWQRTTWHEVISQENWIFGNTIVRTPNLMKFSTDLLAIGFSRINLLQGVKSNICLRQRLSSLVGHTIKICICECM